MLRPVEILCPHCNARTEISVSSGDGKEMHGARSVCRACREPIMTVTLPDGNLVLMHNDQFYELDVLEPRSGPE